MSWLDRMFNWGDKGLAVADKAVIDKDRVMALAAAGDELRMQAYLVELQTRTVPWVDALHKMGRQLQAYLVIGLGFYCAYAGHDLPAIAWLAVGGVPATYSLMKGTGK